MNDLEVLDYVKAAAVALDLPLDALQARRVAVHLARTAGMAAQLGAFPMSEIDEPAEIYSPLAFPRGPDGRQQP
ncbi:MAG: DUF4089 domain-containing protein [Ramlibacter sp.]